MPTLFAISGFLLSSRIRKGWSDPRTRFSVVHSLYLYTVWLLIYAVLSVWFPTGAQPLTTVQGWREIAHQFVTPHTMLWFILGLAFWSIVLASVRLVPYWVVLPILFILTVFSLEIEWVTPLDFYIRILRYGFYFAIGVYLRPAIARAINEYVWWTVGFSFAAYVLLRLALPIEKGLGAAVSILAPLRDVAAVGLAMSAIAVVVTHVAVLQRPLAWIGRRTLPIYVVHSIIIWSLIKIPGWGFAVALPVHRYVAPALWTVLVALTCIGIYTIAAKTPGRYLFDMPGTWRTALRAEKRSR